MKPFIYKKSEHFFIHSSNTLELIALPIAYTKLKTIYIYPK